MTRSLPRTSHAKGQALPASDETIGTKRTWSIPLVIRQVAPGAVVAFLAYLTFGPVKDPDTFWHLRIGQELPTTWQFSGPDPWNSFATRTWTLHEWLPELLMAQVAGWGGLPAVTVLMVAAAATLLGLLLTLARQFTSLLMSSLVVALAFLAMFPSLTPRPHLVTFAFAAVTTSAWLRTAADRRVRWWLIPLSWVWACSHGMWFIGVAIGAAGVVGMLLERDLRPLAPRAALVPTASLLAAALTPTGINTVLSPLTVRGYTEFVSEWVPPSIFDVTTICALVLLAVPIITWARSTSSAGGIEIMLVLVACGVTMAYSRSVAIGAAMAVPLAARAIADFPLPRERRTVREGAIAALLASVAVICAAFQSPSVAREPEFVPTAFSAKLNDLAPGTVVCNDYVLGGWLLWGHSHVKPIIDGRTELYEVEYVKKIVNWQQAGPRWRDVVTESQCSIAIVNKDSAIAFDLQNDLGWRQVQTHRDWVLLAPQR
ncbi:hypothetical protein ACOCJ7_10650 [Knoellia sp. CPCC 206453]|uniref:hypothetical protein n=1 Tax=Knoellia pratensis TaxID=3404796 RepID=UPI0036131DCC